MKKCKHYKTCENHEKHSLTCNNHEFNRYCGKFRELELKNKVHKKKKIIRFQSRMRYHENE